MHKSSLDKMQKFVEKYLDKYKDQQLFILDLGSQDINGTYKQLFVHPKWHYEGADIALGKNVDIVLKDMYYWKEIKSSSYDVVITGQTFEHIEFFWITILEITRILKPGGLCCIIAPSSGIEHKYPLDCWRFYPDGFKALCKYSGLQELEVYTQWDPEGYDDGSDNWKDSVLIGQKPKYSFIKNLSLHIRNWLFHKCFIWLNKNF